MLRKTVFLATLAMTSASHALTMGDIAFTSFNADEDGWSLVTFVDIAADTTIYFRDDEWNGSSFNSGEGKHVWNSGATSIAAGTVIRFSQVDQVSRAVSHGSMTATGDTGLNSSTETIYAYIGSIDMPTAFLAGVSSEGSINLTPAGLVGGSSAVVLTNSTDYAVYAGPRSGLASMSDYRAQVNDAANWAIFVGGDQAAQVPNMTAFAPAVPEPDPRVMLLAGLGMMGAVVARRLR